MNVVFSLRKHKKDPENKLGTVQYYVSYDGQRSVPLSTEVCVFPNDWTGIKVEGRNADIYNIILNDIRADLATIY